MDSHILANADSGRTTLDALIQDTGGCGIFQVLLSVALVSTSLPVCWSTIFMAYGSYNPGWVCLDREKSNRTALNASVSFDDSETHANTAAEDSCDVLERCSNVHFNDGISTLVTEWRLLCSMSWIPSIIMSLQMAGMLVGAYTGGQLGDRIGRKYAHYGMLFLHGLLTLISAFSVDWKMFAALKILLGLVCGSMLSTVLLHLVEFLIIRWRSVIPCIPISGVGFASFAICAMFIKDWRYLHLIMAFISLVIFLPVFWVPESMRWQATKGKVEQAKRVAYEIAQANRKPLPDTSVLSMIAQAERNPIKTEGRTYSYFDIFRRGFYKRTLIICFTWTTAVITFYAIGFGIKALSGNFFINLLLFSAITSIMDPFIPFITNKVGRKRGIFFFFSSSCACCFSIVIVQLFAAFSVKGSCTTIFALMTVCCNDAAWCILVTYTLELYPTVVRGVGYGFANGVGRLGGIVAPFLIPRDNDTLFITYAILGVLILVSGLLLLTLQETSRDPLEDTFKTTRTKDSRLEDPLNVETSPL